ncbi:NEW3 domain-containing protein [Vibrio rotiferianus]|uniref:NEW3 domain-containing protein n=1 Tax=Vibrio rotiferianus TaxID=190895 RepID=UPI00406A860C
MNDVTSQNTHQYHHHTYSDVHESKEKLSADKKNLKRKIQQNSSDLLVAIDNYQNNNGEAKLRYFSEVLMLLKSRQETIAQLADIDPDLATKVAFNNKQRKLIPSELQGFVEQEQQLEGALEVFYEDDDKTHSSRLRYILNSGNSRTEVKFPNYVVAKGLRDGNKVRVGGVNIKQSGKKLDLLALNEDPSNLLILADGSDTASTDGSDSVQLTASSFGEQRTLVMLLNFQDNIQTPWSAEQARELVFGQVNDFYKENSDDQVWLTGDVVGYYTLPMNATCDTWTIHTTAEDVALDNGINFDNYARIVYVFPENSSCGWTGKGTVGGNPSKAYVNGSLTLRTVGHELGHNFGLHHAKDFDCGSDIIGDRCASAEYGDALDIMGMSGITGHFNAFSKEFLGWISTDSGNVVSVEADGSYLLAPVETPRSGSAKGLKIRRGTDEVTGKPLWYYLEYRQAIGFDSFVEGKSGITDGVIFHLATEDDPQSNLMLDMIPNSGLRDLDESALLVGQTYTDVQAGITITTEWANGSAASVHVTFDNELCMQASPSIALTSTQLVSGVAGSSASYKLNVTNNDTNACSSSSFNVSANVPSGWSSTHESLTLVSGETKAVEINVMSSASAQEGSYEMVLKAENSTDLTLATSIPAAYQIEPSIQTCEMANPTITLVANSAAEFEPGETVNYTATITNNDSQACESANFQINTNVPEGWITTSSATSLASGETTSISLSVTSDVSAEAGSYSIDVIATNMLNASYNARASSVYRVADLALVCEITPPLMTFSSSIQEGNAGDTLVYSASLTSQNGSECDSVSYTISADVPNGWSSSTRELSLASGQKASVELMVTSGENATEGEYSIQVNALSTESVEGVANGIVEYRILAIANSSPVANDDSVVLTAKEVTEIDVLANDSDPEGDLLQVVGFSQGSKGSVSRSSSGRLVYTPAKSFKGGDSFSYTISDGQNTAIAMVSIQMSSTSGGGGNKGKGNSK